jgi:cellulose/xylan binding protein with CBM9 domain/uncharacterized protein DUF5916
VARIETSEAPTIDGDLSDPAWAKATVLPSLKQRQPDYLADSTERTVVRVMYDENNLYFGVYLHDSEPDKIVVRAMSRDGATNTADNFNLIIDPSLSRKNSYVFQVAASGGRLDGIRLNNLYELTQWNTIWEAKTKIVADGWIGEVAIPFRSISFNPGQSDWGFVFARTIRRKNENDRWGSTNPALLGVDVSEGATLTGFHDINTGLGLDLQPYLALRAKHDWSRHGDGAGLSATMGGNAFYRVTSALTGTVTVNPDFSDAPLDIRQVNTTRFSLFLPETRSFFLQDAASFEYGGRLFRRDSDDTQSNNGRPFFSRNIGLVRGQPVSLIGGGKLSGESGGFNIGALSVMTDATPAGPGQLLSVVRATRPVFSQSLLGIVVTNGDPTGLSDNSVVGGDFQYRDTTTFGGDTVLGDVYYERSFSSTAGNDDSYGVSLNYPNEPYFGDLTYKVVGKNFTPALGFVNRRAVRLYDMSGGYRLRYRNSFLRTFEVNARQQFFTNLSGILETRVSQVGSEILTATDHDVSLSLINSAEHLTAPFVAPKNTIVPAGDYAWTNVFVHWQTSTADVLSFLSEITCCSYYNGRNLQGHFQANYRPDVYYELQLGYDPSLIVLPAGRVDIHVASLTGAINFTPDMQVAIQAQYDNISESVGFLARYRWEFRPGSDILLAIGQSAVVPAGLGIQPQVTQASLRVTHTLRF